jgi:hypothetical protein
MTSHSKQPYILLHDFAEGLGYYLLLTPVVRFCSVTATAMVLSHQCCTFILVHPSGWGACVCPHCCIPVIEFFGTKRTHLWYIVV